VFGERRAMKDGMRSVYACLLAGLFSLPAFSQTVSDHPPAATDREEKSDAEQVSEPRKGPAPGQSGEASRSTLEVAPGKPGINSSKVERKPISPWKRVPGFVLSDQKSIWTSPFHTSKQDVK
jgi:hypothetical protein